MRFQMVQSLTLRLSPGAGPFCHRLLLHLEHKQVPYTKEYVDFADKPEWYDPPSSQPAVVVQRAAGSLVRRSPLDECSVEHSFVLRLPGVVHRQARLPNRGHVNGAECWLRRSQRSL